MRTSSSPCFVLIVCPKVAVLSVLFLFGRCFEVGFITGWTDQFSLKPCLFAINKWFSTCFVFRLKIKSLERCTVARHSTWAPEMNLLNQAIAPCLLQHGQPMPLLQLFAGSGFRIFRKCQHQGHCESRFQKMKVHKFLEFYSWCMLISLVGTSWCFGKRFQDTSNALSGRGSEPPEADFCSKLTANRTCFFAFANSCTCCRFQHSCKHRAQHGLCPSTTTKRNNQNYFHCS